MIKTLPKALDQSWNIMREFLRFVLMRCVAAPVRRVRLKNCRNYCRVLDKF